MDYCYTCRRTLNGALVCPGCGACTLDTPPPPAQPGGYSGGILPPVLPRAAADPAGGYAIAESTDPSPEFEPGPTASSGPPGGQEAVGGEEAAESVLGSASIAPTLHRGRAARRRQMARWKKTRRRAGVATAFALFGGGVTVASMHSGAGRSNTSATASRDTIAPVTLQTGDSPADGTNASTQRQAAPGHANSSAPHGSTATTGSQPAGRATQPVTDSAGSSPLNSGNGNSSTTAKTSGTVGSLPSATSSPTAGGGTSGSSGSGSGSDSGSGSGSTASGGNGGGTVTTSPTSPPTTPPPATTSPTTPPSQHGLCVLILCID